MPPPPRAVQAHIPTSLVHWVHKMRRSKLMHKLGGVLLRGFAYTCAPARAELCGVLPKIEALEARIRGDGDHGEAVERCYSDALVVLREK